MYTTHYVYKSIGTGTYTNLSKHTDVSEANVLSGYDTKGNVVHYPHCSLSGKKNKGQKKVVASDIGLTDITVLSFSLKAASPSCPPHLAHGGKMYVVLDNM